MGVGQQKRDGVANKRGERREEVKKEEREREINKT